jgi:hypothetical protein
VIEQSKQGRSERTALPFTPRGETFAPHRGAISFAFRRGPVALPPQWRALPFAPHGGAIAFPGAGGTISLAADGTVPFPTPLSRPIRSLLPFDHRRQPLQIDGVLSGTFEHFLDTGPRLFGGLVQRHLTVPVAIHLPQPCQHLRAEPAGARGTSAEQVPGAENVLAGERLLAEPFKERRQPIPQRFRQFVAGELSVAVAIEPRKHLSGIKPFPFAAWPPGAVPPPLLPGGSALTPFTGRLAHRGAELLAGEPSVLISIANAQEAFEKPHLPFGDFGACQLTVAVPIQLGEQVLRAAIPFRIIGRQERPPADHCDRQDQIPTFHGRSLCHRRVKEVYPAGPGRWGPSAGELQQPFPHENSRHQLKPWRRLGGIARTSEIRGAARDRGYGRNPDSHSDLRPKETMKTPRSSGTEYDP